MHQLRGRSLSGCSTHLPAASLLRFFAFQNVNEGYARIICDLVLRSQLSVIDILRDEISKGYGKAVCEKDKRSVDRENDI
jgi:hypothetical protein